MVTTLENRAGRFQTLPPESLSIRSDGNPLFVPTVLGGAIVRMDTPKLQNQLFKYAYNRGGLELEQDVRGVLKRLSFYFSYSVAQLVLLREVAYWESKKPCIKNRILKELFLGTEANYARNDLAAFIEDPVVPFFAFDLPFIAEQYNDNLHLSYLSKGSRSSFNMFMTSLWVHEREHLFQMLINPGMSSLDREQEATLVQKSAQPEDADFLHVEFV